MQVEIWSDVVCPWCYLGKRRFEKALERFDGAADVDIVWRSFQLDPAYPQGVRTPLAEHLAAKMGGTVEQVRAMNERVTALAAAEGLTYRLDRYTVVNTLDAHRIAHLGKAHGLSGETHERLLRAQLVEGEVLDDASTLVRLATEAGLDGEKARQVLATDAYATDVAADIQRARALGVSGVPFYVIDSRYGISGAQATQTFLDALVTVSGRAA